MTAPRKPVAWIREGAETVMHNVRLDEPSSGPWIALAPIADLQPLWALVEKYGQWSDERQAKADRHNDNGDAAAAEFDSGMAEAYSRVADELRKTMEAMQ